MLKRAITCLLLVILCENSKVIALKCYECTNSESNICGQPLNKSAAMIVDCRNSIYTFDDGQAKIYACMYLEEINKVNNQTSYTRRCSLKNLEDTCQNILARNNVSGEDIRTNCRQCDRDLCNSSTKLSTIAILTVFFSFISFM